MKKKHFAFSLSAACFITLPLPASALPLNLTLVSIIVENFNLEPNQVTPVASLVENLKTDSLDIDELIMAKRGVGQDPVKGSLTEDPVRTCNYQVAVG
ncbi:MAG: hypothetical protein J0M12_07170 [Deltaproteobacteria bacterium]|nr:hypothetical protein [Deltaproteobacteria bacterium]